MGRAVEFVALLRAGPFDNVVYDDGFIWCFA